jgi:hypothetical protein
MNLKRWLSVILMLGLVLALSPPKAQAWPNQPISRQAHPRAFAPHQPRGHAFGWQGQRSQWHQPQGHAYGPHAQRSQWHQPRGQAYGWHGQRSQWQQPRHPFAQGPHPGYRQFQPPAMGQQHNPRLPYTPAAYPGHPQAPYSGPRSQGYAPTPSVQGGQAYSQPGVHYSGPSGNASQPQAPVMAEPITSSD